MIKLPKLLAQGDVIAITCPAGAVEMCELTPAVDFLEAQSFRIKVGKSVGSSYFKFSASDEDRIVEFQNFLDDDSVRAILCGRGGYGVVRIIDKLDFSKFSKLPKWIIGYSDITNFHNHIHTNFSICTLHAPMLKGFGEHFHPFVAQSLIGCLVGHYPIYQWDSNCANKLGSAVGEVVGGNLAILSDLCGTNSDIDTQDKILVIEDVSEYLYNIDRMFFQLKKAGKLKHLKALIVGSFADIKDNEIPFGQNIYEIIMNVTQDYSYPIVFDFPFGHQVENYPIVLGMKYKLQVDQNMGTLEVEPLV